MYLQVALLVSHYLIKSTSTTSLFRAVYSFCIIIFAVIIILLAAKISILLLAIYIPYGLYVLVLKNNKWFVNALVVVFFLTTTLFIFNKSAVLQLRIREGVSNALIPVTSINAKSPDVSSSQMRKLIWQDAITLIKQKPLGYTTGDVDSALVIQYIKTENALATQKHLNAHNQFLQTTLALGIVGLLTLLSLLYYPLFKLNKEAWFFYLFFSLIITFNFLTESMLQTQSGIVFFVLSYCILVSSNTKTITQYKME
ncbi:MAG: O-antigen ligase family protein [Bacteroidia bacterium]|nr:O-antigen ligase family protein [Bacteroidia bacterium]